MYIFCFVSTLYFLMFAYKEKNSSEEDPSISFVLADFSVCPGKYSLWRDIPLSVSHRMEYLFQADVFAFLHWRKFLSPNRREGENVFSLLRSCVLCSLSYAWYGICLLRWGMPLLRSLSPVTVSTVVVFCLPPALLLPLNDPCAGQAGPRVHGDIGRPAHPLCQLYGMFVTPLDCHKGLRIALLTNQMLWLQ